MNGQHIAIVVFSEGGTTRAMAQAIAEGSGGRVYDVTALSAADWAALDAAGAIVMGTPTYMGGTPARFAEFIEVAAERWDKGLWRDKLAGGFTTAMHPSGDKLNVLVNMSIFAAQMGMIWVGAAETGAPVVTGNEGINADGSWLGVMGTQEAQLPERLSAGDLETARRYGLRLRRALNRWEGGAAPASAR
jgi:NAD(P)H dehydrogenase (quinone)